MSPPPVRDDTNASDCPSGEKSGRRSYAGSATRRCASPPAAGTTQMSPPDENAISRPSGEMPGSAYEKDKGAAGSWCAAGTVGRAAMTTPVTRIEQAVIEIKVRMAETVQQP